MCGICGVIDLQHSGRIDPALLRAMTAHIAHRGPDGDGFYASPDGQVNFGMRRLSIIDVVGSDQPLYNEDRTVALVFNGEIYNYRELRADLMSRGHKLHTEGDGETLAHLYEQSGLPEMFRSLRGMSAFALHDTNRKRNVLAVDHIGMKPLYLWEHDGLLSFASEVKCFLADPRFQPRLNLETLDAYLSFGFMIGEQTLFEGVRRIMPGHFAVVENGVVHIEQYWRFGEHSRQDAPRDIEPLLLEARSLLDESVQLHLRSDVPLGLFLSGGVDSATILALMAKAAGSATGERVKTYTIGYDSETRDNELLQARHIAGHFGTDHHERVISADDWWAGFDSYVYHHDEPNANASAVSLMLLSETTAQDVKVVLTGLGGDELFGGYVNHHRLPRILESQPNPLSKLAAAGIGKLEPLYPTFKRYRIIGALPTYLPPLRHRWMEQEDGLLRSQSFDGMVFTDTLRGKLYNPALKQASELGYKRRAFAEIVARSQQPDPANTAQALVINTWLTGNALMNCDKVTMAHSLEARVPFFDPALMDFAAGVPPEIRMVSNKYVLREAMRPLLPAFALERPKQPFSTPILEWFRTSLSQRIQERLLDSGAFIRELFEPDMLEKLLRDHFDNRAPQVEMVFRLLTLETWAKRFLRQETAQ